MILRICHIIEKNSIFLDCDEILDRKVYKEGYNTFVGNINALRWAISDHIIIFDLI